MAVNKPTGDNARKGAVKKRTQLKTKLGGAMTWTRSQDVRRVHGAQVGYQEDEGRQEIQGRSAGEVMGKVFLALMALSIAVLIGLSAWIILI